MEIDSLVRTMASSRNDSRAALNKTIEQGQVLVLLKSTCNDMLEKTMQLEQSQTEKNEDLALLKTALYDLSDYVKLSQTKLEGDLNSTYERVALNIQDIYKLNENLTGAYGILNEHIERLDGGNVRIGRGANVDGVDSVALGSNSVAIGNNIVSFGHSGMQRRLVNVADGRDAFDAVNKRQLDKIDGRLTAVEKVVKVSQDEVVKPEVSHPSFAPVPPSRFPSGPQGPSGEKEGCADCPALERLDGQSVKIGANASVSSEAEQGVAIGNKSKVNAAEGVALGKGASVTEGAESAVALGAASEAIEKDTVSVGNDELQRRIVHVAAARDDHDAVNLAQLKEYAGQTDTRIKRLDRDMKRGFARQSALSALMAPVGIGKCNVTAALGGSGSTTALAVGAGYRPNNHVAVRFGVSGNTGSSSTVDYNVGASYEW